MEIEIKKLQNHELDRFIDLIKVFENIFEMQNFLMPENIIY